MKISQIHPMQIHPIKMVLFAAAFMGGLMLGWIYHAITDKETHVEILVATQHIEKGQRLERGMFRTTLTSPRALPSHHILHQHVDHYIGKKALHPIMINEPLRETSFDRFN